MALTQAEQRELQQLETEEAQLAPSPQITPDELAELQALEAEEAQLSQEPGLLQQGVEFIGDVGETVDKFTGAPTRAALEKVIAGDISAAPSAFAHQFGADTSTAPTGQDIAEQMGVPSNEQVAQFESELEQKFGLQPGSMKGSIKLDPLAAQPALGIAAQAAGVDTKMTPSEAAGLAVETVADPLSLIPGAATAKKGTQAAKGAARLGAKGVKAGTRAILKGSKTARMVAEGADTSADVAKNIARTTKDSLKRTFKPIRVDDFDRVIDILKKNDIDPDVNRLPEALEFGERTSTATAAKVLREGPGGDDRTKIFNTFLDDVDAAAHKKVEAIGTPATTDFEAGEVLVDSYNKGVDEFFKGMDVTYNNFNKISPEHRLSGRSQHTLAKKLRGLERFAKKEIKLGFGGEPAKAKQILNDIEAIRNTDGSYKETVEAMQRLGKVAFSKPTGLEQVPIDRKRLQRLYFDLRDIVTNEVGSIDKELAQRLKAQNKASSKFLNEQSDVSKIFAKGKSSEVVFKNLIERGNVKDIRALKDVVPEAEFDKLRATFLNNLIKADSVTGRISYKQTINKIQAKSEILGELFADSPELLEDFNEVMEIGKRSGDAILNHSGTDRSASFREFLSKAVHRGVSESTLEVSKKAARRRSAPKAPVTKKPKRKPTAFGPGQKVLQATQFGRRAAGAKDER